MGQRFINCLHDLGFMSFCKQNYLLSLLNDFFFFFCILAATPTSAPKHLVLSLKEL